MWNTAATNFNCFQLHFCPFLQNQTVRSVCVLSATLLPANACQLRPSDVHTKRRQPRNKLFKARYECSLRQNPTCLLKCNLYTSYTLFPLPLRTSRETSPFLPWSCFLQVTWSCCLCWRGCSWQTPVYWSSWLKREKYVDSHNQNTLSPRSKNVPRAGKCLEEEWDLENLILKG